MKILKNKYCLKCGIKLHTTNMYPTSIRKHHYICKECSNHRCLKIQNAQNQKFTANLKQGMCCAICGYKKHLGALQFHHSNPEDKCFEINCKLIHDTKFRSLTNKQIAEEMNKCILLCANCHIELHDKKEFDKMEKKKDENPEEIETKDASEQK